MALGMNIRRSGPPRTDRESVAQNTFDILGGVLYILCICLEGGIFASHLVWLFRTREVRKTAEEGGKTFDDLADEYKRQGIEFAFAERGFGSSSRAGIMAVATSA